MRSALGDPVGRSRAPDCRVQGHSRAQDTRCPAVGSGSCPVGLDDDHLGRVSGDAGDLLKPIDGRQQGRRVLIWSGRLLVGSRRPRRGGRRCGRSLGMCRKVPAGKDSPALARRWMCSASRPGASPEPGPRRSRSQR
jgi:hypothetical protein